jgi:hypothetical protein
LFAPYAFAASAMSMAASLPDTTVPQSCGVQLKGNNNSPENLDQIRELGFKFVRRGFGWEAIEKTVGVYDFTNYDRLMDDCQKRGLGVLGCIAFNNKLYGGTVLDDRGRDGYAKFAAALAAHYKDRNILWEIWNEPNVRTFWGKHGKANSPQYAAEYVALVKVVAPAMHKADPHCIILGGATSGLWSESYKWMGYCFQSGILQSGIDAWSVHPYSVKCPEDMIEAYATVRKLMVQGGAPQNFPLLNSERGYPIGKAEGFAGGDLAKSHEYQAWHFVRQYMIDLLCDVKLTNWYEWSGKEGFSLLENGQPTPAYHACRIMIEQLNGYRFDKRIPLASPRDFALRFTTTSGGVKIVAWAAPPEGQSPDKAEPHAVDVPVEAQGTVPVIQIYGEKGTTGVKNGAIRLTLLGAPQYVVVRASP